MGADGGLGPCGHRTRTLQRQASLSPFPRFPSAVSDAQMPQGVRADLSAAYRAMLEALLPRFGALRGAAGPAPDSTSARMLTGFKRALRQRGAPLPLLLPDAVAMFGLTLRVGNPLVATRNVAHRPTHPSAHTPRGEAIDDH